MSPKEYRPTLAQLRTFVTIAEKKHFGTAAQALGISQPSLSQALVALETGLGFQLIERSTRRVIVTSAGLELMPYAKATLEAADAFLAHSRGATGTLTGPLSIGIIPTAAPYILSELLPLLKQRFPDMAPRIIEEQTGDLLSQLRDGQLDVALLAVPSEANGIVDFPLYTEDFAVVVPAEHPLAGRDDLTLANLSELDLLLLDDGHCLRDQVLDLCRRAHINPSEASSSLTRATSLTTIIQLVAGGFGATLIPESAFSSERTREGIALSSFADSVTARRTMGLAYRASSAREEEFRALGASIVEAFQRSIATV
ncbi:hydrogen peroxide-inducible genes activator [Corynebacterium uterequi]|uniref:Probable hydrogen peroxide-inducible genes activator n=1 Tax=Corynebacterium uterequi TaxID=1072256 RepID=A0A0G3HD94_9CORY|nr:hydrogen peroxide-inducible genes activator [Corynebacterium uterequi]AKK11279.1 transcriptional regulator [Corynebacterium uterequi]